MKVIISDGAIIRRGILESRWEIDTAQTTIDGEGWRSCNYFCLWVGELFPPPCRGEPRGDLAVVTLGSFIPGRQSDLRVCSDRYCLLGNVGAAEPFIPE